MPTFNHASPDVNPDVTPFDCQKKSGYFFFPVDNDGGDHDLKSVCNLIFRVATFKVKLNQNLFLIIFYDVNKCL